MVIPSQWWDLFFSVTVEASTLTAGYLNYSRICPGPCGSVDWASSCATNRLSVRFPVRSRVRIMGFILVRGMQEPADRYFSLSPSLKINFKKASTHTLPTIMRNVTNDHCFHHFIIELGFWVFRFKFDMTLTHPLLLIPSSDCFATSSCTPCVVSSCHARVWPIRARLHLPET